MRQALTHPACATPNLHVEQITGQSIKRVSSKSLAPIPCDKVQRITNWQISGEAAQAHKLVLEAIINQFGTSSTSYYARFTRRLFLLIEKISVNAKTFLSLILNHTTVYYMGVDSTNKQDIVCPIFFFEKWHFSFLYFTMRKLG